jgi:hypothetical protein
MAIFVFKRKENIFAANISKDPFVATKIFAVPIQDQLVAKENA